MALLKIQTRAWSRLMPRLFIVSLAGILLSSCGTHDQSGSEVTKHESGQAFDRASSQDSTKPVAKVSQPASEPSGVQLKKPILDLSIDKPADDASSDAVNFDTDLRFTIDDSPLAATLNKKKTANGVKLGGKLFTDETRLENRDYLNSLDGVQVNFEGNFD